MEIRKKYILQQRKKGSKVVKKTVVRWINYIL